jgi:hypothetical protein
MQALSKQLVIGWTSGSEISTDHVLTQIYLFFMVMLYIDVLLIITFL